MSAPARRSVNLASPATGWAGGTGDAGGAADGCNELGGTAAGDAGGVAAGVWAPADGTTGPNSIPQSGHTRSCADTLEPHVEH